MLMTRTYLTTLLLITSIECYATNDSYKPIDNDLLDTKNGVLTFAAIGDYGDHSKSEQHIAELVQARKPEFIITMGDNNYPLGCWETIDKNIGQYYSSFIGDYKGVYGRGSTENRFYPSIGNHDWAATLKCRYKGSLPYLSYFTLPNNGLYYDFKKGSVHFFAIDSDAREPDGNTINSKQYQWLKQKLAESNACFKVVYFHHSAYSSGTHGPNKDMQWKFDQLGADFVISGHDHDYERIMRDNIAYLVNGASGADLYPFKKKVEGSAYRYNSHNGYMMGYADKNRLGFAFYNKHDVMKDNIMLVKNCT